MLAEYVCWIGYTAGGGRGERWNATCMRVPACVMRGSGLPGDDISARGACVTSGRAPQERMRIGMHVRLTYGTRRVGRPAATRLRAGRQPRWGWAVGARHASGLVARRIQGRARPGVRLSSATQLAGYGWRRRRSAGPAGASDAVCVCWTIGGATRQRSRQL